ncbi:undecaprenyl-diphosphate phosphatase [Psychroflexus lacisalsi]|jgi:undecaprenyl-diphosphatase|uniref:Undecaprenyl-diphosphatase n=1 Tax=Psychroflexus lacisalsi TaxID=503928 RepID=A0ABN1K0L5_9FLAO|nr:undecaprenyl-diphosphate phosphatase [Psychroflexus lacisalsi]MBZ9620895.1 undecaprenyl-diphosphate phosphatase [Psychroflexus lacisalsi]
MDVWDASILGIIQGLTEFLPVSSSGHLELGKAILGDDSLPKESLLLTVILHFATALSTIVIFRKDIAKILKGLFSFKWNEETKFSLKIIISMIPAALVGYFFESEMEVLFGDNIILVGFMLIFTSLLLWLTDKAKATQKPVSYTNSFVIGVAQAIAILPGISRSGATIATSVILGNDKSKAARFSFLMVVPLIFGKIAKDIAGGEISTDNANLLIYVVGFITAFVSGLFACTWMISIVKRSKLKYFAIYCFFVGVGSIIFTQING